MVQRMMLFAADLVLAVIITLCLFCANPVNSDDPTSKGYNPTTVDLNVGKFSTSGSDTIRNNYTTDSKIIIDLQAVYIQRIDSVYIDINAAAGNDQKIVVAVDTLSTKWIDGTKYALPAFGYNKAGVYHVVVTVKMKNGQETIKKDFYVEVKYTSTVAKFLFGDVNAETVDTIQNAYTTETPVNLDIMGTYASRIDSVVIDIDLNSGDDPHIIIRTDTLSEKWNDDVRYQLGSWKYAKPGLYTIAITAKLNNDQEDITVTKLLKISGQPPAITRQPISKELFEGDSVHFTVDASGTADLRYSWYRVTQQQSSTPQFTKIKDVASAEYIIGLVQLEDSGSYACIAENDYGSATSEVVTLNVKALPPDENSPLVSFSEPSASGTEGNGGSVKVKLSKPLNAEVAVSIGILPTTTADTGEYKIVNSVIRFGANETEKILSFTTKDDSIPEPDKIIDFYIKAASRANVDTSKNKYTYTILDDDSNRDNAWPKVSFEKSSGEGLEREAGSVRLNLSKDTTYSVTVRIKATVSPTMKADDFTLSQTEVTFAPNETSKLVPFTVKNDNIHENDESVKLQIEIPEGQKVSYGTVMQYDYTIHDDDPSIVQFAMKADGVVEKDTTVRIPVILTAKNAGQVTAHYSIVTPLENIYTATSGIDYAIAGNNTVTFKPLEDTAWIDIAIKDDTIAEEDEFITLVLTDVTGGSALPAIPDTFNFQIRDNENTSIGFENAQNSVPENIGDTAILQIWMSLTGPVQDTVRVEYGVAGGNAKGTDADYEIIGSVPQYVVIKPGDTRADIRVRIFDNKINENIKYFDLQLLSVTGGKVKLSSMNIHRVYIIDDDAPYFSFGTQLLTVDETSGKISIPVKLSNPSVNKIRVRYAVTGGTATGGGIDYALTGSDTLQFDEGDTTTYIEVLIVKDALDEYDETVNFTLLQADTSALPRTGSVNHTLTIRDNNDAPGVGFSTTSYQIPEEGSEILVPVSLAAVSGKVVTVKFQISGESANWNGGDVSIKNNTNGVGTITFPSGTKTQNISVTPVNDMIVEGNETFAITLFSPENAALAHDSTAAFTIVDNDYNINIQASGSGTVKPSGSRVAERGTGIGIKATPVTNNHFIGWQATAGLSLSSMYNDSTYVNNITTGGTVTAKFSIDSLTITLVAGTNGNAIFQTASSGDFKMQYNSILSFDNVVPAANYHFKSWLVSDPANLVLASGSLTSSDATFQVKGSSSITPVFEINKFSVSIVPNNTLFGSVTPNAPQTVSYNGSITPLTATQAAHYHFIRWVASGGLTDANLQNITSSTAASVNGIQSGGTVTAIFGIDSFTVALTTDAVMGDVSFNQQVVPYNTGLTIEATNKTGYHFIEWKETAGSFSIAERKKAATSVSNITANGTIAAVFAIDTFTVQVVSGGNGTVSPDGANKVVYNGTLADVRWVTAAQGYQFKNWTLTNAATAQIDPDNIHQIVSVINVKANNTITANFEKQQFLVAVTPSDADGVKSININNVQTGSATFGYNTTIPLSVELNPGWRVDSWTNVTTYSGTSASLTVMQAVSVTVNVSPIPAPASVICVKQDAPQNGGGTIGSSWVDAYTDLRTALANAQGKTVWVARGTYTPHPSLTSVSFDFPANCTVIGGFAGNETDPVNRDSLSNATVLSGLLNSTDKSACVVNVPAGSDNVVLNTVIIENANGTTTAPYGGVYAANSNYLTLFRCVIRNNYPCGLEAGYRTVSRQCVYTGNKGTTGAAIKTTKDSCYVMQCVITGNEADQAPGIYCNNGTGGVVVANSTIVNNKATSATTNKTAGIYKNTSGLYLANTIVWGNVVSATSYASQLNYTDTVLRCDIQDTISTGANRGIRTKLNTTDGWLGVLDIDPQFISMANPAGSDGKWFTDDDGLMLISGSSACSDAGRSIAKYPAWNPSVDIRGKAIARSGSKNYDMGAYDQ